MFKKMKHMKNEKGLTLIELLAVIVILAIIAAIAIPAIGNIINNQRDKAILSDGSTIISGAKIAYSDGACATDTCTATELAQYVEGVGNTGYSVTKNNSGWTLNYDKLVTGNFKSQKYKDLLFGTTPLVTAGTGTGSTATLPSITEANLLKAMGK